MKKHFIFSSIIFLTVFCFFGFSSRVVFAQQCDCVCSDGTQNGIQAKPDDCLTLCRQINKGYDCTPTAPGETGVGTPPVQNVQTATLANPLGSTVTIPQIAGKLIKLIMGLVGILSLLMFIYAGFIWMTAQGKPDAITKGKNIMIYSVLGLLIIFSSYIILSYVFKILTF